MFLTGNSKRICPKSPHKYKLDIQKKTMDPNMEITVLSFCLRSLAANPIENLWCELEMDVNQTSLEHIGIRSVAKKKPVQSILVTYPKCIAKVILKKSQNNIFIYLFYF